MVLFLNLRGYYCCCFRFWCVALADIFAVAASTDCVAAVPLASVAAVTSDISVVELDTTDTTALMNTPAVAGNNLVVHHCVFIVAASPVAIAVFVAVVVGTVILTPASVRFH